MPPSAPDAGARAGPVQRGQARRGRPLAHACAVDPKNLRAAAVASYPEVAENARARYFEREVFTCWGTAVTAWPGRSDADEYGVYKLAVRRGLWRTHWQRPLEHFQHSLTRRPFWDSSLSSALRLWRGLPSSALRPWRVFPRR